MIATLTGLQWCGVILACAMMLLLCAGGLVLMWGIGHAPEQPDKDVGPDGTTDNGTRSEDR